jgi:hypothetical protein
MSLKSYDEPTSYEWGRAADSNRFVQDWLARQNKPANGLFAGTNTTTAAKVYITPDQLGTHTHVLGSTGVGKSFWLEALIEQLIAQGNGLCLIDPHGDLYHRVLSFCAYVDRLRSDLRLSERVIPFDIAERRQILGFNPMRRRTDEMEIASQARAMMETIRKCWGQASFDATPRLGRWLYNICYALIEADLSFVQAYHLVNPADNPYRAATIAKLTRPTVKAEWEALLSLRLREREERLESSLNRIKPFIELPAIWRVLCQRANTLDFNSLLNQEKILLVNLNRQNVISEDDQKLLGALLINELMITAFAKSKAERKPFFLICDEFEKFVTRDMAEVLDGGRKFGLHLILAHQHLAQLKEQDLQVYNSALTNARTKVVFGGLCEEDLDIIAKELFTGELDPDEIKSEIYRTIIHWPESTREIWSTSESYGGSDSYGDSRSESWSDSRGYTYSGEFSTILDSPCSHNQTYMSGSSRGSSSQTSTSYSSGSTRTIVPFLEPHEDKELSSRQYRSLDEQLYIKKAPLKRLPKQNYALLLPGHPVQMLKSPTYAPRFLPDFPVTDQQKDSFLHRCFDKAGCFKSPAEVDQEVEQLEEQLRLDYEASVGTAAEDDSLIEQCDSALVNKAGPTPERSTNPASHAGKTNTQSSPAKSTRHTFRNRKKKKLDSSGKKKAAEKSKLPELNIEDNPITAEE